MTAMLLVLAVLAFLTGFTAAFGFANWSYEIDADVLYLGSGIAMFVALAGQSADPLAGAAHERRDATSQPRGGAGVGRGRGRHARDDAPLTRAARRELRTIAKPRFPG